MSETKIPRTNPRVTNASRAATRGGKAKSDVVFTRSTVISSVNDLSSGDVPSSVNAASGPNAYARLVGVESGEVEALLHQVRQGLPFETFESLARALAISTGELLQLVQIPARTLQRRRERGRFESLESDRLLRLARLFGVVLELFEGDASGAQRWMQTPQRAFGGDTALQMSVTEVGAREVERLVGQLEQGVFV